AWGGLQRHRAISRRVRQRGPWCQKTSTIATFLANVGGGGDQCTYTKTTADMADVVESHAEMTRDAAKNRAT
ncbi:MAG: hypothetical protein ACI8RE_003293, partial [Ilumatobacter sp.]